MLKRFLSLMLALSMVLSLACVSAFAAEETDPAQGDSAEAVAVEEPDAQHEETVNDTDDSELNMMEDPKVWVDEPTVELGVKKSHSLWIYPESVKLAVSKTSPQAPESIQSRHCSY